MTGRECVTLKQRTEMRLTKIKQQQERAKLRQEKFEATKERWNKLNTESALSRRRKSPLLDFVDDLVHRPPNTEQMRQLKELLLEEQKAIAQLLTLINQHLE